MVVRTVVGVTVLLALVGCAASGPRVTRVAADAFTVSPADGAGDALERVLSEVGDGSRSSRTDAEHTTRNGTAVIARSTSVVSTRDPHGRPIEVQITDTSDGTGRWRVLRYEGAGGPPALTDRLAAAVASQGTVRR